MALFVCVGFCHLLSQRGIGIVLHAVLGTYFKPLLDPGGGFTSKTTTGTRFQKRNGRHETASKVKRLKFTTVLCNGHSFPSGCKCPLGCDGCWCAASHSSPCSPRASRGGPCFLCALPLFSVLESCDCPKWSERPERSAARAAVWTVQAARCFQRTAPRCAIENAVACVSSCPPTHTPVSFIQVGPLGNSVHISMTTPIVPA
jgi:hypothetical protein